MRVLDDMNETGEFTVAVTGNDADGIPVDRSYGGQTVLGCVVNAQYDEDGEIEAAGALIVMGDSDRLAIALGNILHQAKEDGWLQQAIDYARQMEDQGRRRVTGVYDPAGDYRSKREEGN